MSKLDDSEESRAPSQGRRLESWKAIANHLNRTVRTVHRWEKEEGLPVHRHLHRKQGTVYAYRDEIDEWWARRSIRRAGTGRERSSARLRAWLAALAAGLLIIPLAWAMFQSFRPQSEAAPDAAAAAPLAGVRHERPALMRRGTDHPEAHAEYLKGRYFLGKLDRPSFLQARSHFQQALDLDPLFAGAWSGLSETYNYLTGLPVLRASDTSPRARAAAERALALDPRLAEAHAALALVLTMYYWDSEAAERHFRQAIELDPSYAVARRNYAAHLRNLGRFDEALAEARRAEELDPLAVLPRHEQGVILFLSRRYDAAIEHARLIVNDHPSSPLPYLLLAKAHAMKGRHEEALAVLEEGDPEEVRPGHLATRGYLYARMGRYGDARRMVEILDGQPIERAVNSFHKSVIHIALGEHERALDLLEDAAEERAWLIRLLGVEPIFDPLRGSPRFQALLHRLKLSG